MFYLWVILLCAFTGCQKKESVAKEERPIVLVTLSPYASLVKSLAEDLVQVETLIPEGANPHLYEAPPQAVEKHRGAALWLYVGENFDKRMLQVLKESGSQIRAINLAQGVDLIGECGCHYHAESSQDLHIWMSPQIVKRQITTIKEALIDLCPESASLLKERAQLLSEQLEQVHLSIHERLKEKQGAVLLVAHPAFAYFCREYGLEQLSIEIEGKDPRPQDLERLVDRLHLSPAQVIVTEPQHSSKGAEALGAHLNIPLQEINPYAENYFFTLEQLTNLIAHDK
ncbi:MAG: hypothetical protein RLZZ453_1173 [Chlamydiota bacterium]|jgi:zinc transport system substrate-binding protein